MYSVTSIRARGILKYNRYKSNHPPPPKKKKKKKRTRNTLYTRNVCSMTPHYNHNQTILYAMIWITYTVIGFVFLIYVTHQYCNQNTNQT